MLSQADISTQARNNFARTRFPSVVTGSVLGGCSCSSSAVGRLSALEADAEEEEGVGLLAGLSENSRISNIFRL